MGILQRLRSLINRRPLAADVVFAAVLLLVGILEQDFQPFVDRTRMIALVGSIVPLIARRHMPFSAALIMYGFSAWLQTQSGVPAASQVSTLLGLYTLGMAYPTRQAIGLQLTAILPFVVTLAASMLGNFEQQFTVLIVLALFTAVTITASELSKSRSATQAALEERATQLEDAQRNLLRLAIEDERSAIARELHDVLAHNVSVMVLQAGAAKRILETQPVRAVEALDAISESGRRALAEMRLVVGVLRPETLQGLEPQPALNRLDALIRSVEAAGVPVHLEIQGTATELPIALELSAYRIIQESLTNTMQHAGRGAVAHVKLAYEDEALELSITDNGKGPRVEEPTPGHGLLGIAERVAMFKGSFSSGPLEEGGFHVTARLPLGNAR